MQVIIDIPDELYNRFRHEYSEENLISKYTNDAILEAFCNGTPLPKGHGRLGDLNIILNKAIKHRESYMEAENSSYCRGKLHAYELYVEEVENAPIIIEADTESEVQEWVN